MSGEPFHMRCFNWLARESSRGRFYPEIDGLRFVAIVAVVLFHLAGFVSIKGGFAVNSTWLGQWWDQGSIGVQLFFMISGFVIAMPFARARMEGRPAPRLRNYLWRRITRLEPPYLISLVIMFILLVCFKGASIMELLPHLAASMLYLHNQIYAEASTINTVAWSLEVECQFYLLAPFLCRAIFRLRDPGRRRGLLLAVMLGLAWVNLDLAFNSLRYALSVFNALPFFLGGLLMADIRLTEDKVETQPQRKWLMEFTAWGGLMVTIWLLRIEGQSRCLLPVVIFVGARAAFKAPLLGWLLRWRPVYTVGGHCYTIYLWHFLILSVAGNPLLNWLLTLGLSFNATLLAMAFVVLPVVFTVSAALFALLERPFMIRDWPSKGLAFLQRKRM